MKIGDLKVVATPKPNLATTNRVYVHKSIFTFLENAARTAGLPVDPKDPGVNCIVGDWIYEASYADGIKEDEIALNSFQRTNVSCTAVLPLITFYPKKINSTILITNYPIMTFLAPTLLN